jgi:hypothetical protein
MCHCEDGMMSAGRTIWFAGHAVAIGEGLVVRGHGRNRELAGTRLPVHFEDLAVLVGLGPNRHQLVAAEGLLAGMAVTVSGDAKHLDVQVHGGAHGQLVALAIKRQDMAADAFALAEHGELVPRPVDGVGRCGLGNRRRRGEQRRSEGEGEKGTDHGEGLRVTPGRVTEIRRGPMTRPNLPGSLPQLSVHCIGRCRLVRYQRRPAAKGCMIADTMKIVFHVKQHRRACEP